MSTQEHVWEVSVSCTGCYSSFVFDLIPKKEDVVECLKKESVCAGVGYEYFYTDAIRLVEKLGIPHLSENQYLSSVVDGPPALGNHIAIRKKKLHKLEKKDF